MLFSFGKRIHAHFSFTLSFVRKPIHDSGFTYNFIVIKYVFSVIHWRWYVENWTSMCTENSSFSYRYTYARTHTHKHSIERRNLFDSNLNSAGHWYYVIVENILYVCIHELHRTENVSQQFVHSITSNVTHEKCFKYDSSERNAKGQREYRAHSANKNFPLVKIYWWSQKYIWINYIFYLTRP